MTPKHILVIDDDRKFLKILEDALTPQGYAVKAVHNGELGMRSYFKEKPDLILVDGLLPHADGFQICDKIRNDPNGKDIPIIMMTAIYKMPSKEREARIKYKVKEYLTKPIDLQNLLNLIEKHAK